MELGKLEIYQLSLKMSDQVWEIYKGLPKQLQFSMGDQLLRSVDSIGANIAEGYGRFHYNDSKKFYYNARGSLWESKHWVHLVYKRELIEKEKYDFLIKNLEILGLKLNGFIKSLSKRGHDEQFTNNK